VSAALGRPRLLFLCHSNPWRLNNGGIIRNYWLIVALAQRFEIDLVTADDAELTIPSDFAQRCAGIYRYPRATGMRGKLARALGALRPTSSYYTSAGVSAQMRAGVARLARERAYCAVVTELAMVDAIPPGDIPVVYAAQNSEATLLARRASVEPLFARLAMTVDALRVRRIEAALIRRSRLVTPCSQNDIDDMAQFAPGIRSNAVIVPNGVDCRGYAHVAQSDGRPGVVLITGSFDWQPNRRGLLWFIKNVLPRLEQHRASRELSIRVAGRMSADFAAKLNAINLVTAVPNVPKMDVEMAGASVLAVAVIASSGTRLRILEGWAAGRPVVTTPEGAFGLNYTDGRDLLACPTPELFAHAILELLDDAGRRAQLRAAGLLRAEGYDWAKIGTDLLGAFVDAGLVPAEPRPDAPAVAIG
jgi:glycosyltransferase involved in cell wall biosynthesis